MTRTKPVIFRPARSTACTCGSRSSAGPSAPARIKSPPRPLTEQHMPAAVMKLSPPIIAFSVTSRRSANSLRTRSAVFSS
jgi:hypothetical protein